MTETFSQTADTEGLTAFCDPQIIPIFPLRFALKAESLLRMISTNATPRTPTSIDAMPDHELLRIRRGYIYTFDGTTFQLFWFQTRPQDENGAIYNPRTGIRQTPAYMFQKYEWPNGVEGNWEPINEYYPYAFVPKDTPVAWVAYSETAWPVAMIANVQNNPEFRDRMMTRIDLASRSGPYCAPITELAARVPAFRAGSVEYAQQDYSVANAIRMTATKVEPPSAVVTCTNTAEKGVMIALPDPIGEMQDILALLSVHVMTLSNYTAQHQYPLMIGKGVRNYADAGAVSAAERWFRKPPLSAEFEVTYASLLADISALNHQMARLVWHWVAKLAEQGFGSFRDQVACCMRLTKRYSLQNHPRNHTEACAYALWLLARTKPADAADAFLVQVASILFGAVPFDVPGDSGLDDLAEQVKDILDLTSRAFGAGKEIHSSFKPALNAMMTVYATEIVNAASSHRLTPASGLVATMFRRDTVRSDAQGIKRAFTEMLAAEGYHGMPFPRRADTALDGVSAKIEIDRSGSPGQIAFARYSAQIDLSVDSNYRRFARISESFDLGANGFGLVAAGMSLHMTIQEWNRVRHEASAFGRVANDPGVVVTAAFAEAYAAAYHIARAGIGMTATGMSRTLATDLFDRAPRLAGTAGFRGAAFIEGAVANKTISATARIAGGVGIVMSAALAAEGFKRGDDMMFAGNAIMAVAGTFLFMTSGPVAILAGAAIIVGAVMASFSFDDVESWVNEGFWGRSRQYWGKTRPSIQAQIADAKQLAFPGPSSSELKAFYEAELQRYIEMNSALNITPLRNGRIRVDCAAIQTAADMSRLSVDVKYDAPGWQLGYQRIPGIRKDFESAGVAIVTVPAGNYAASDGKFIVEGRMRSIGAGSIDNDITLTERELW